MGIEIKYIAAVCIGLCASFWGMAMFRIGRREVEKQAAEPLEEERKIMPLLKWAAVPQSIWQAVMCAGNVGVALFLTAVYAAGPLGILQIIFLCTVLYVCAWTDCRAYLIPNKILLAALFVWMALFVTKAFLEPWNVRYAAVGAGISAAALLLAGLLCRLFVPGSVGFGDLKLFIVLGLYLGADHTWNAVFYTLLASFAVSVFLLVTKRASRKSLIPFAPFLLAGTLLTVFFHGV